MYDTYDNSDKVINIPIKDIKPNPYKVRRFFDVTSVSDLADSIKEIGLLQPILVRKIIPGSYELISGERRLRGAEIAGLDTIRAIVMDISDNQSAVFALAENFQRKNINFFEKASACYHLLFDHDIDREQISKKVGMRETVVSKMLKLSRLSSTVKNIIIENNLTEEHAFELLNISDESERINVLKKAIELQMDAQQLKNYICTSYNKEAKYRHRSSFKKPRCAGVNDYKIVFNTFKQAIKLVEDAGIKTKSKRIERDNYYEYVIRICK